jgi:hypothetical protein
MAHTKTPNGSNSESRWGARSLIVIRVLLAIARAERFVQSLHLTAGRILERLIWDITKVPGALMQLYEHLCIEKSMADYGI